MLKPLRTLIAALLLPLSLWTGGTAHAMPTVDILFVLDASGSTGGPGFEDQKALTKRIHADFAGYESAGVASYRYSVIRFGNVVTTLLNFSGADSGYTDAKIDAISFTGGASYHKDAVQRALDLFGAQSPSDHLRQMFLFTDGNPNPSSQSPNSLVGELLAASIHTTVLGLDGFFSNRIEPLIQSPADAILMSAYTSADSAAINARLLANVAPDPAGRLPEPGTLGLAMLPLAALLVVRRRKAAPAQ